MTTRALGEQRDGVMVVRDNRERRRKGVIVVAAVAIAACGGGDDAIDDVVDDEAAVTTVGSTDGTTGDEFTPTPGSDLTDVSLAAAAVEPFDTVLLDGVSGDLIDGLALWVRLPDGDVQAPLFEDERGVHFSAMFHPTAPFDGGPIDMYLSRGDERGPVMTLEVAALEQAPGAFDRFVADLRAAIDATATELGTSFDELAATDVDDVPAALLPLKLAQSYLDDGSERDVESFPDFEQLTDDERVLLDAVVEQIGLSSVLVEPGPVGFRRSTVHRSWNVHGPAWRPVPSQSGCIDGGIEIADAADLSASITTARKNTIGENDIRRDVLDDIGTVTTVGGFIPGVGWMIAGTGVAFSALEAYMNGTAGLYPSSLTSLTVDVAETDFPEDFQAPSSWSNVQVTARSTGWTADADVGKVLLGTVSTATSAFAPVTSIADDAALNIALYVRDNVGNAAIAANAEGGGGVLEFCPQTWTVDVSGEPWSTGKAVLERFSTDPAGQTFEPIETGLNLPVEDTLSVEIEPSLFAGQFVFQHTPISVQPIRVTSTAVIEVDQPGEEVTIAAEIANALDPELSWESAEGGWRGDARLTSAGAIVGPPARWERDHITPDSDDAFPYLITIESTSSSGLRADGDPPRNTVVEVRLKELIVVPAAGSVFTGRTLQYEAFDRDGNRVEVDWQASGGVIDANGLFTAGDTPGTFQVTATLKSNSSVSTTVPVQVVKEDCVPGEWRLREQDFLSQLTATFGQGASMTHTGGQYLISMGDDGSYTGRRDNWTFDITLEGQTLQIFINSVETGTWIVDVDQENMTVDEFTSDATVRLSINGQPVPGGAQQVESPGFGGSGTYECSGDLLTVTVVDAGTSITATLDRIG